MLVEWMRTAAIAARNVVLGASPASWALARRPRALVSYASESLFMLNALRQQRGLPERYVLDVLPRPEGTTLRLGGELDSSWFRPVTSYLADFVELCILCRVVAPRVVFEIGTFRGYSALHFALNTPPDSRVYTLDLPPGPDLSLSLKATLVDLDYARQGTSATRYAFTGSPVENKIQPLHGDSARFDFSPWHRGVDLFFVDGAHSYEYVRSDTDRALACLRPGGAIAWHDFGRSGVNGVGKYLREVAARGLPINVVPGGSLAYAVNLDATHLH